MIRRFFGLRFVRDSATMQLASAVQAATYFVTSLLTARALGPTEMGRWGAALELYLLVYFLLNMGLERAAVAHYSEAVGRGDRRAATDALAAMLKLGGIVVTAVVLLGFGVAPLSADVAFGDRAVGELAAILSLASVGELTRALTVAALTGALQMRRYLVFDAAANILRVAVLAAALAWRPDATGAATAYLCYAALSTTLSLLAYRRARRGDAERAPPPLREVLTAVPTAPLARLFGLSYMLALNRSLHRVVTRVGILVIPSLSVLVATGEGMAQSAAYKVGFVMNLVLQNAVAAVAATLLPTLGVKLGRGEPIERMGPALRRVSLATGALTCAATVLSVPVVRWIILDGYGPGFEEAYDYYLLLAVGNLFVGFGVVTGPFYVYANRLRASLLQNVVYALVVLGAMAWATDVYGAKGLAGAVGIGHALLLLHLVYMARYYRTHRSPD